MLKLRSWSWGEKKLHWHTKTDLCCPALGHIGCYMKAPRGCIADIKFIFCGRSFIFLILPATGPAQNVITGATGDVSPAPPASLPTPDSQLNPSTVKRGHVSGKLWDYDQKCPLILRREWAAFIFSSSYLVASGSECHVNYLSRGTRQLC